MVATKHESHSSLNPMRIPLLLAAVLVAPLTIGDGAKTGAGAVVTKDVPPGKLAVGVPARVREPRPVTDDGATLDEPGPATSPDEAAGATPDADR